MSVRRLQKMIHVGCHEPGIDSETRRDLQLVVTGNGNIVIGNQYTLEQEQRQTGGVQ